MSSSAAGRRAASALPRPPGWGSRPRLAGACFGPVGRAWSGPNGWRPKNWRWWRRRPAERLAAGAWCMGHNQISKGQAYKRNQAAVAQALGPEGWECCSWLGSWSVRRWSTVLPGADWGRFPGACTRRSVVRGAAHLRAIPLLATPAASLCINEAGTRAAAAFVVLHGQCFLCR